MKKVAFIVAFALVAAVAFAQVYKLSVTKNNGQSIEIPTDDISKIEFVQGEAAAATFDVEPQSETVPYFGGNVSFKISANCQWTYKVNDDRVTEVSLSNSELVLKFPGLDENSPAQYKITFEYSDMETSVTLNQDTEPKADLLDIEFLADGTAKDVSPMKNTVITKPSNTLMTYYNDIHKRYAANFRNGIGSAVTSGYYRINYTKDGEFINKIADGCTFETIIMLGETDPANSEVKWFSSMQAGGIGFILPIHSASIAKSNCMTFLPNTSPTGTSYYRWCYSSVVPQVGTYYHVVGVWNKELGKAYIYINGELSGTVDAPGNYVPVASGAESFIIGGDPGTNQTDCDACWNGDVVSVRIYDAPLEASQVAKLWEASKFDTTASSIQITDLQYINECEVGEGYKYTVYGNGFEAGDVIELQDFNSDKTYPAETVISDGAATITIPSGFISGKYRLVVKRGASEAPVCVATFTVSADPMEPVIPKIIAHRGAHTDGASENSIAALKKAMDANYYGIELDIWITTDNKLVVHHDGVASGLTFYNCTYDQIKNLKLSNGEYLPTFESFIETFKEKMGTSTSKLIIEIKTHGALARTYAAVDNAMEIVENNGLKDRVEYIAFSYDACKRIISKQPDALVGYLNGDKTPAAVKADGIPSIDYSYIAFGNYPEWIKQARDLGMIVNVWTINGTTEMLKYMGLGAHYITTDAPADLEELCKKTFISSK